MSLIQLLAKFDNYTTSNGDNHDRYSYGRYENRYGCRSVRYETRDWNGRIVTRYQDVCDGY